jgi:hypothetical protein
MFASRFIPAFAIVVVTAAPLLAQAAPRTLPAPNATFEEPFSSVGMGTVRELSDGRLIVADARDKVVQRIDLRTGQAVAIGREGSGPAEFGMPLRLFGAPADTTLLFDPLNTRYLVIGPDAKPVNTFRTESETPPTRTGPGGGRMMIGGGLMARAADARGRLYAESSPLTIGADGRPKSADSAAVVRYDRGTRRLDTLTYVKLPAMNIQMSGSGNNIQSIRIGGANPLTPRDEWTVFPDGRVAIVRAGDYHVDWIMPNGAKRSTPAVRYAPIRMTAAEIRHEEGLRSAAQAGQMSIMMTQDNSGSRRTAQMGPPAGAPPPEPLTDWPEVKPPFRPGFQSVLARPNGELWVRRTEGASAKGTLYDVFNAAGSVAYQVRVQEGWTLVGFGNGTVYTTRKDEDDLVYLQRHSF